MQLHVTDAAAFRPYALYLRAIAHVAQRAGADFAWRTEPYEFVSDRPAIDLLTGGPEFRRLVDSPSALDDYLAAQDATGARSSRRARASGCCTTE